MKKIICNFCALLKRLLSRPTNILEKLEEGFQFPFSHVFFQVVSLVGVVVIFVGFCVFLYSVSPVFEKSVSKPEKLTQREITAEEVLECSKPVVRQAKTKSVSSSRNSRNEETVSETNAEGCGMPEISFEKLQAALPNTQFTKQGRKNICEYSEGYYEYGDWGDWVYPSRCYELGNIDSKFATNLRETLQQWFPCNGEIQQGFLEKMASHLFFYSDNARIKIFNLSLEWMGNANSMEDINETWALFGTIDSTIGNASNEQITQDVEKLFGQFSDFMQKNSRNGKLVLLKSLELIKMADGSKRLDVFKTARAAYKKLDIVDGLSGEWERATTRFISLTALHTGSSIVKNLECFYKAYEEELEGRVAENNNRTLQYERELKRAQMEALGTRVERRAMMPVSGTIILVGLGGFLIVVIILVLFSLQRSVSRLEKLIAMKDGKL